MSESPYASPQTSDCQEASYPLKWRLGRAISLGLALGGVLFVATGHVIGLPPGATAGGEVFGGVLIAMAGLILASFLLVFRRSLIRIGIAWHLAVILMLVVGCMAVAIGFWRVNAQNRKMEKARSNIQSISDALDAMEIRNKGD